MADALNDPLPGLSGEDTPFDPAALYDGTASAPPIPPAPPAAAPVAPASAPAPVAPTAPAQSSYALFTPAPLATVAPTDAALQERLTPTAPAASKDRAAADSTLSFEQIAADVKSGDAKRRPTESDYKRMKEVSPFVSEDASRAFALRLGLDPNDQSQPAVERRNRYLGYERMLEDLGYNSARLAKIAERETNKDEDKAERKAVYEAARERLTSEIDDSLARMREQVATRLQQGVDGRRDAALMARRQDIEDKVRRDIAVLENQRRIDQQSQLQIARENELNSYVRPSDGRRVYLPGYQPREVATAEALGSRYDRQREALQARFETEIARLNQSVDASGVNAAQADMRSKLAEFDRQGRTQKSIMLRSRLADFNEFLQLRLNDAMPPGSDGKPLPYVNDTILQKELAKRAASGGYARAAADVALNVGRGAIGSVLGISQLATGGVDLLAGTGASAYVQSASDWINAAIDAAESDALKAQREIASRRIAEATAGKEGAAALGSAAWAGLTNFGFDRATLSTIGQMAGALAVGGAAGRVAAVGRAAAGAGAATEAGAATTAAVSQMAAGGPLRLAGEAIRNPGVWAITGQAADSYSHQYGELAREMLKNPAFAASDPVLTDLRANNPALSEQEVRELYVRRLRNSAAVAGGAATLLTMMTPGLGGVESQLLRVGAPLAAASQAGGIARRAATEAYDRILFPAASNAAQQVITDSAAALGAGGTARQLTRFVNPNEIAAGAGSAAAIGGIVGGANSLTLRRPETPAAPDAPDAPAAPAAPGPTRLLEPPRPVAGLLEPPPLITPPPREPGLGPQIRPDPPLLLPAPLENVIYAPSPEAVRAETQRRISVEAARIVGENVDRLPEVQRVLTSVHGNFDAAIGAQLGTTITDIAKARGTVLPDGGVLHFANNDAHYEWAQRLVQGKNESVVFSTPPIWSEGASPLALTRAVDDTGAAVYTLHGNENGAPIATTFDSLRDASVDSPEFRLALRGAAVVDGMRQLGIDVELANRAQLDVENVLATTTAQVNELRRTQLFENGVIDPAVYAGSALETRARVRDEVRTMTGDAQALLQKAVGEAAPDLFRAYSEDNMALWRKTVAESVDDTSSGLSQRARQRARSEVSRVLDRVETAVSEMRQAVAFADGLTGVEEPATRARTERIKEIVSAPIESVPADAMAVTLATVPSVGRFKPGSTRVIDAENPGMRSALRDNAVYGLAEQMIRDPSLTVAQARNLALHFGAGLHAPLDVISDAIAVKTRIVADRADAAAAAKAAHDEVTRVARAREAWQESLTRLRLPAPPAPLSPRARMLADTARYEQMIAERRRLVQADFEKTQAELEAARTSDRRVVIDDPMRLRAIEDEAAASRQSKAGAQGARDNRGGQTTRAEAPDGFTLLGAKAATPIDARVLSQIATTMMSKFSKLRIVFDIVNDDADRLSGGSRGYSALTVNDASGVVRIILNRDRIGSVAEAKNAIWHELYGHFTPRELLGDSKFARLNEAVLGFARSGKDKASAEFLAKFRKDYRDTFNAEPSREQQAAEVLAHLIETNREQPADLVTRLTKTFAGSDFARGGITQADLQHLLDTIVRVSQDGRYEVETARMVAQGLDSFVEPDHILTPQRMVRADRSAFSMQGTIWPWLTKMIDGRAVTTNVARWLASMAPNDPTVTRLVERFVSRIRNVQAQTATRWQTTFKDPLQRISHAIADVSRETGRSLAAVERDLDRLITARHAITRNTVGYRLSAPMEGEAFRARRALIERWERREIGDATLMREIEALQTPEVMAKGMEDFVRRQGGVYDPEVHLSSLDSALFAGSDLTIPLAKAEIARLGRNAAIVALDKRVSADLQTVRSSMLAMMQATGYDPHNYSSFFANDYVPLRPQSTVTPKTDYERIGLQFNSSMARMKGLGDQIAPTAQIATMHAMSHRAAREGVAQETMLDFAMILQKLAALDGRYVRILQKGEPFKGDIDASIAVIQNRGRFGGGDEEAPTRSGLDRSIAVRDKDGVLGGEKGDYYEIVLRDKDLIREFRLDRPETNKFLAVAGFATRSVQGAFTQYNPGFIARNAWVDYQQAIMSGVKYGVQGDVARHASKMYRDLTLGGGDSMFAALREYMMGSPEERAQFLAGAYNEGSNKAWVQAFVNNGGHMLFESLTAAPAEANAPREIVEAFQRYAETGRLGGLAENVAGKLETWRKGTEVLENIARLSLFRALAERGLEQGAPEGTQRGFSLERAAAESKALTLDYHRTSPLARMLAPLFAFANPAIVDLNVALTNRIWKNGKAPTDIVQQADGTLRETFRPGWWKQLDTRYITTRASLGVGQILLLGAILSQDEWNKLSLEDLANNWIVPGVLLGQNGYNITIPKNFGVDRVIDGVLMMPLLSYFGHPRTDQSAREMFNIVAKNLSPGIDFSLRDDTSALLDLIRSIMPTVTQPLVDTATGVDRFGRPTRANDFRSKQPAYASTRPHVDSTYSDLARAMFRSTDGVLDFTGDQAQQLLGDYARMIPLGRIFYDAYFSFGRQSQIAQINADSGRPELNPVQQFVNALGGPAAFRESTMTPETELARLYKDNVLPIQKGRADAREQDMAAGEAPRKRSGKADSLDPRNMGPREREYMAAHPAIERALRIDRKYTRERNEANRAFNEARARGDGPALIRAATEKRRVASMMIGELRVAFSR
jgi:hypothetical protein